MKQHIPPVTEEKNREPLKEKVCGSENKSNLSVILGYGSSIILSFSVSCSSFNFYFKIYSLVNMSLYDYSCIFFY